MTMGLNRDHDGEDSNYLYPYLLRAYEYRYCYHDTRKTKNNSRDIDNGDILRKPRLRVTVIGLDASAPKTLPGVAGGIFRKDKCSNCANRPQDG